MRTLATLCLLAATAWAQARPPVVDAAKSRDKAALRTLINQKADVKAADPEGATALHWAAHHDDAESVDLLLRAGADANTANDLGATPLWLASQNGNAAIVKRLLDAKANPNRALLSGETPLMVAARGGSTPAVELLLKAGANPNARGTRDQTALMWAAGQQHPETVRALVKGGADIHAKSAVWGEVMAIPPHGYLPYNKFIPHGGETALMFAARSGDLDSLKILAEAGADVNAKDAWGVSATVLAAHSGFTPLVEYLLSKGADPNQSDPGFSALHIAIMRRDLTMATALLERGGDANFPVKTWTPTRRSSEDWHFDPALIGASPLWMATRFYQPDMMRLLLKHGAKRDFVHAVEYTAEAGFGSEQRKERTTLVMAAAGMGRAGQLWVAPPAREREPLVLETVKLALELAGDINATGLDGRTALDGARQLRYQTVIDFLTANGATGAAAAPGGRGARPPAPAK